MQKGYLKMQRYIALQKIVELGSFTKAANLLGYTQPAMSQMISSLEKELSIKLLYRSRYGVHLTLEGEKLYPFIQRTVAQYQSMLEMVKEIRGLESGVRGDQDRHFFQCISTLAAKADQKVSDTVPQCTIRTSSGGLYYDTGVGADWGGGFRICEPGRGQGNQDQAHKGG